MTTETESPRVWVIQEGRNDYAAAEDFGEVRFITDRELSKVNGSQQNVDLHYDIRKFLTHYVPGIDFIIPAGNPMVVAIVTMSIADTSHQFLKWDGRRAIYIPYTIARINK